MYSSFSDDSVSFRRSSERNISQSYVGSIDSKKRIEPFQSSMDGNVGWRCPFGDMGEDNSHTPIEWSWFSLSHSSEIITGSTHHGIWIEPMWWYLAEDRWGSIPNGCSPSCIMDHGSMTVWCSILMTQTFRYDFSVFIYTEKIAMIWHNFFGFFRWPPPQKFIYYPYS